MTELDAEVLLRRSKRPLVIGMGGGGDIVGALATAEFARRYDGVDPVLGGVTWERRQIDPLPGPRSLDEIVDAAELAEGIVLASPQTRIEATGTRFAESKMAEFLGRSTVLVDPAIGPEGIARGLKVALQELACDLLVMVDVGGDVLAHGDEPGLRSPLCDSLMLAAAARLSEAGYAVLLGVFGLGCDGELTFEEALERLAEVSEAGGLLGVRGLTPAVAERLGAASRLIPTEASALPARAFRGETGIATIRGGACTVELNPVAVVTFFLDPLVAMRSTSRLARAVVDVEDLHEANRILNELGVRTELDLETAAAARVAGS